MGSDRGIKSGNRDYLLTSVIYFGKPYNFINSAINMKWRYVILHFFLIFNLLFIPVFVLMIRTNPHELYQRIYSFDFEKSRIVFNTGELFSLDLIDESNSAIYVFEDVLVYADPSLILTVPVEFFDFDDFYYSFNELFDMISVYNLYITQFLLPFLGLAMLVVLVLQVFFMLVFAFFLGLFRAMTSSFSFAERLKIVIMSSLPLSLVCMIIGFFLPAIHIIIYQMLNILMLLFISKRYDAVEREMLDLDNTEDA